MKIQQQALMQYQYRYETIKYTEKSFSLIINKSALSHLYMNNTSVNSSSTNASKEDKIDKIPSEDKMDVKLS